VASLPRGFECGDRTGASLRADPQDSQPITDYRTSRKSGVSSALTCNPFRDNCRDLTGMTVEQRMHRWKAVVVGFHRRRSICRWSPRFYLGACVEPVIGGEERQIAASRANNHDQSRPFSLVPPSRPRLVSSRIHHVGPRNGPRVLGGTQHEHWRGQADPLSSCMNGDHYWAEA
jgi:hypothetical protein